jgi:tetratricopeptide (TPR) repeat protein
MGNSSRKEIALLLMMLLLSFPGCSKQKKVELDILHQTQKYLIEGDYQKTIEVYIAIHNRYPEDEILLSSYINAIEDIKSTADNAFEEQKFSLAGKIYRVLLDNFSQFEGFEPLLSFDSISLNKGMKISEIRFAEQRANQHMSKGDFQKALDSYKVTYTRYSKDEFLVSGYAKIIEDIRKLADTAFEKEDYTAAGKTYHILLKNYLHFNGFTQLLSFDEESMSAGIAECSKFLTKQGLEQYRKGDITKAITIWEYILVFDPSNEEIKKAIDTASIQLKNLQKK